MSKQEGSFVYTAMKALLSGIQAVHFREVEVIGLERIPLYGPVIFVGNHSNQFVDALMLIVNLPRQICFLVAAKSFKRPIIGHASRLIGSIPVARPQDLAFQGSGKVRWEEGGNKLEGLGTKFGLDFKHGDKIALECGTYTVEEVVSETEMRVQEAFKKAMSEQDKETGAAFKALPKVDQHEVFDAVSYHLQTDGCIGIFPEGGSHDRTTLLPLKPGVAIMALSAMLEGAEDVTIVPVGLNYYQPHRFRSQAVVEIGMPIVVPREFAELYQTDRRKPVQQLLNLVEEGMRAVLIPAQDYEEQKAVKLCASLFVPERTRLSAEKNYFLQQKFSQLFAACRQEEELKGLKQELQLYDGKLKSYGIEDAQVWRLKVSLQGAGWMLVRNLLYLLFSLAAGLPLAVLWLPILGVSEFLAEKHRKQALAESSVKVKGVDVIASYKIMVALVLVPLCNFIYGIIAAALYANSWGQALLTLVFFETCMPFLYYVSIRRMEKIPPLVRSILVFWGSVLRNVNMWREDEREIASQRMDMQVMVREVLARLGGKVSANFLEEMYRVVPKVVLEQDSRRLLHKKEDMSPGRVRDEVQNREEIL